MIRLSYAINTSRETKEQKNDTIWVVRLGFEFKTKLKATFKTQDGNLEYAGRFEVKNNDKKGVVHLLVSDEEFLNRETVSKDQA